MARKFYYDRKKKFLSSVWQVVLLCQFLVLAGNRQFFCCGRKVLLRPKKKVLVVCLADCAVVSVKSFITTGKNSSSEIGFGCTYYYVLGVPYSCGVVLVFLVLAGNSFLGYVRT